MSQNLWGISYINYPVLSNEALQDLVAQRNNDFLFLMFCGLDWNLPSLKT